MEELLTLAKEAGNKIYQIQLETLKRKYISIQEEIEGKKEGNDQK